MGKEFTNLTQEQLCDLMCGGPEPEPKDIDMKYVIMCGRPALYQINGEYLTERTIRLLKENGVSNIVITSQDERYKQFEQDGVRVIPYCSNRSPYYWVDCFMPCKKPVCYVFGDVFFSPEAIRTIVETETDDIEFFASAPPFDTRYTKPFAEPFAYKVVDTKRFFRCVKKVRQYQDNHVFRRDPAISWELWQVVKHTDLNVIRYDNYTVINDYTRDVDHDWEENELNCFIKKYGILNE